MGNNGSSGAEYHFVRFRCNRTIEAGERMHTVMAGIESPTEDGSIKYLASDAISTLCGGCASVLLSEAVMSQKLVMPPAATETTQTRASNGDNEAVPGSANSGMKLEMLISSISDERKGEGSLEVHCLQRSFCFTLRCTDGVAWATSQLFTWKQIAQLLIAADPDMFGHLDDYLHQIFPQTCFRWVIVFTRRTL